MNALTYLVAIPAGLDARGRGGCGVSVRNGAHGFLEVEDIIMQMYFFDVILKVKFEGKPMEALVYKAVRAESEHLARRSILLHFLKDGFQVLRLTRVQERSGGVTSG